MTRLIRITAICCLVIFAVIPVLAGDLQPSCAPRAPEQPAMTEYGRGFVPPPMDLSYIDGSQGRAQFALLDPPARWDWRESGDVSSVKNQGSCGACYAFASLGNIEAKMLIDGAGTFDFSENNAKECNWYESSCGGGNFYKTANLFAKHGVVLESCDPYVEGDDACNSSCEYIKTLLDWRVISGDAVPATDDLKNYIMANGPVYTTLYAGDGNDASWSSEFNAYDGSYTMYYTGAYTPNHAVLIVGWDDTLSHAGGTGGWIVKNSWGTSWGGTCGYGAESGYFKIAYGSASIGKWSSYMNSWQDYDPTGEVYYYDEGGWTNSWGFGTNLSCYALAAFTPTSSGYLRRVEFWTTDATSDIDIYVYGTFTGLAVSDLIESKSNLSFTEAGYHSVALDNPPAVTSGVPVYVVVQITNVSATHPIASDDQGTPETATTYLSVDGSTNSWVDIGDSYANDLGIRIRTSSTAAIDDQVADLPSAKLLLKNYPNPFNGRTMIEYGLPVGSMVNLSVYDILGRHLETLVDEYQAAGTYQTTWDGGDIPSGYYFYKLQAGGRSEAGKMLLLK
jgi:C1A family cysteine protease